ncbi:hypothetical protein LEMLEM_LOCUS4919, partial [Lemmus lemmus]
MDLVNRLEISQRPLFVLLCVDCLIILLEYMIMA